VMPLDNDEPQIDTGKITVLVSNNVKASVPSKRTTKTVVKSSAVRRPPSVVPKVAVLDDAVKLRNSLRETLVGVNVLIRSIKSQRRHDKLLRDTVASLRKLQNV